MEALLTLAEAALVPKAAEYLEKNTGLLDDEKQRLQNGMRSINALGHHELLARQVKDSPYEMRELAKGVVLTEIQQVFVNVAKGAAAHRKTALISAGDAILEKIKKISL